VFDIGAQLGDRSAAFAALGARVVALEPQPRIARWLRRLVGRRRQVVVREEAVGSRSGVERLAVSHGTPTVSTLSEAWRTAVARDHPGFGTVRWEESVEVSVVTLDELIDAYGTPDFCKIDVEGYEAEVLAGLTRPLPALSVEFVASQLDVASACVRRLDELGAYRFNAVLGEGRSFVFSAWRSARTLLEWLDGGADGSSSGDIYARLDMPDGEPFRG
jgi:FkbM family methyltransferase